MPLGSGNFVQSASGEDGSGLPSVDVTLSAPTTGGTVLIGIACDDVSTPPSGFVQDAAYSGVGFEHKIFRKQVSTGETVFTVTFNFTALVAWWVAEVTGLDTTAPLVAGISDSSSSTTSMTTGTTATVTETDLLCVASWGTINGSSATVTFSGETNSFTEDEDVSNTSGVSRVAAALAHRFPGVGGTFETTATLSNTAGASGMLVVYKASSAPVSVIDDVSVGGTFGLTALVTARAAGDTSLDLYTDGTTVQGSIVLVSDLSVTGTMNYSTAEIGVTASSVTFTVGDVVQSDSTGECMVVRDAWTDDGPRWSNTTTRATVYTTTGWTVIGSASLS